MEGVWRVCGGSQKVLHNEVRFIYARLHRLCSATPATNFTLLAKFIDMQMFGEMSFKVCIHEIMKPDARLRLCSRILSEQRSQEDTGNELGRELREDLVYENARPQERRLLQKLINTKLRHALLFFRVDVSKI